MKRLNILIVCEESQAETEAFRRLGHRAFSADLQPAKRGTDLGTHFVGDCRLLFHSPCRFKTQDGKWHHVARWHLIIAHPPCTYLCRCGAVHMVQNGVLNTKRFERMQEARRFFFEMLDAPAKYVAVENPVPMSRAGLPPPSCFVQPFWFGHKYSKKTLFWLKNLPPIMPEIINPNYKCFVRASRGKYRSRTFTGVAKAMAEQWSAYILDDLKKQAQKK